MNEHITNNPRESKYFMERDAALLAKRRAELDAERLRQEVEQQKQAHWMRCPKCGDQMREVPLENVKIDKCDGCAGLFFDRGELEELLEHHQPHGLLRDLWHKLAG